MVYKNSLYFFCLIFAKINTGLSKKKIQAKKRLIGGNFEPREEGFELVEGHGVPAEVVCALEGQPVVRDEFAQLTQIACTTDVLHRCDLPEIVERPVEFVAVDVVDFHAFGSRADEGLPDQMMTETVTVTAHTWVSPAMRVRFVTSHRRAKTRFEFFAGGIVELAVRAREEDLVAYTLRRNLFDNWYL